MAVSDGRFVHLQAGLVLPLASVELALTLEERGFTLTRDGDVLVVSPADTLTPDDCARIRKWKHHLLLVLAYTPTDAHLFDNTVPAPQTGPLVVRRDA